MLTQSKAGMKCPERAFPEVRTHCAGLQGSEVRAAPL